MNFFQPTNREELASALASLSGGSIVAGCTDFLAQRNGKVWHADAILSLTEMQELKQIELAGDSLAVGAVCVHSQIYNQYFYSHYFISSTKIHTCIKSFILEYAASFMPLTFFISSIHPNPPFSVL